MKKKLARTTLIVSGLMVISLIAGCSPAPDTKKSANDSGKKDSALNWNMDPSTLKGETVTILAADSDGSVAKMMNKFTDETGIKLNFVGVDFTSMYNKITIASLSNSSDIDLVEMDTIWAGQFLKGNIVEDLTNVVPEDAQKQFTQSSLNSVKYDNKLAAVPYFSSTKHFYWNNDLLKKAGISAPPKTWTEFREVSKKLTQNGIYSSGWSWKQAEGLACDFVGMVYSFGGQFFDKDGNFIANSPESVKALQYMTDLIRTDKTVDPASLQWTEDDVKAAFAAGKIAMMSNWEGMYPDLNDPAKSKVVNQTDVGLLPGEGKVVSATVTGSEGIAMMKASKHKQAALAFLKWMSSKNFQQPNFIDRGQYPVLQSLYTDPEVKKADTTNTIDKILAQFQYGQNRPNGPGYVEWADILSTEIFNALSGGKTPQAALDDASKKINEAIKKAK
ncbi:extracellular solute-binding protein [Paenibacillus frigoriresistens]|uniref:extracellular solute-binding protein n=1 Tax=Paenibacillus alginolyticus TaxID=59839 RepID=UPI001566D6AF|nr:extracellular solute-binding protein [Paenibacillus frigoriresistens]NRF94506.1 extracellular solute-binding protein [Paenibacillus frigoriresistens]